MNRTEIENEEMEKEQDSRSCGWGVCDALRYASVNWPTASASSNEEYSSLDEDWIR